VRQRWWNRRQRTSWQKIKLAKKVACLALVAILLCECVCVWLRPASKFSRTGGSFVKTQNYQLLEIIIYWCSVINSWIYYRFINVTGLERKGDINNRYL
jgi:hypothetical protein